MKITDALRTQDPSEPSIEDRVTSLEVQLAAVQSGIVSFVGTVAYNDSVVGEAMAAQIQAGMDSRREDDAAEIGG